MNTLASRLLLAPAAAVAAAALLAGCTSAPQTPTDASVTLDEETREALVDAASAALADAREAASHSFSEVIMMADRLAEMDPEIVSPIPDDLAASGWVPSREHISLNRLQTRAEVAVEKSDTEPESIENSRLILIKEGGAWKLDDLAELYGDSDVSLRESIENLYAGYAELLADAE